MSNYFPLHVKRFQSIKMWFCSMGQISLICWLSQSVEDTACTATSHPAGYVPRLINLRSIISLLVEQIYIRVKRRSYLYMFLIKMDLIYLDGSYKYGSLIYIWTVLINMVLTSDPDGSLRNMPVLIYIYSSCKHGSYLYIWFLWTWFFLKENNYHIYVNSEILHKQG